MEFLSNTYNPDLPDARMNVARLSNESEAEAWRHYQEWLKGKFIGEPQATEYYSVAQLKAMNMVGVYAMPEPLIIGAEPDAGEGA